MSGSKTFVADDHDHDHTNLVDRTLSQYVPLTEEERKAKLEDLRKKLVEKRAKQAEDDAKANRANEVGPDSVPFRCLTDRSGGADDGTNTYRSSCDGKLVKTPARSKKISR